MRRVSMISWSQFSRAPLLALVPILVLCSAAQAETTVTISHPEVTAPTLIDQGEPGESVGDVRIFHFDAEADDGSAVRVDWVMTTTAIDAPSKGIDSRISTGVFSMGEDAATQLILQGVAFYPGKEATMKVSSSAIRVIAGGSGRFAGARGWVESIHLDDGSWQHVFHIE